MTDQHPVLKKEFIFFEGRLPAGYRCCFPIAIFNRSAYRYIQSPTGWRSFYVLAPAQHEAHASFHFFVADGIARSPLRAPFGSLEVSALLPQHLVYGFLDYVNNCLKDAGLSEVFIKNPPELYAPEAMTLVSNFFVTRNYSVEEHEVGAIVPVTRNTFTDIIHPRKKRKLHQCRDEGGLNFRQLQHTSLPVVYEFIEACRQQKNYRLSITLKDLQLFVERFPSEYLIFAVYHDGKMVAASVTIRTYPDVLYHFISDHIRRLGSLRPALILMEGIYNYCQTENIRLLDLGTSTVDGEPNFKLVKFKCELGAQLTHKFTFSRRFR